ncbi:MAG: Bacterial type II secretion system protein F domain protein [Syntrophus sp. PtaB.Bin001]|nr:MAG: Bacterial type II secretion system protein F domain protein [Syntrophus sp. PtaB.Bin001]
MFISIIIPILIFSSVFLFITGIYLYISSAREHGNLLAKIQRGIPLSQPLSLNNAEAVESSWLNKFFSGVAGFFGRFARPKNEEELALLKKPLGRIGYRNPNAVKIFWGVKILLAIIFPGLFLMTKPLLNVEMAPMMVILILALLALAGFYLPNLWLRHKIEVRQGKIMEGFPDALDLMVICVEAGMGIDQAINRVGEEMKLTCLPLMEEFKAVNMEMRIGRSRREALKNMADRTGLDDVNSLVTLLIQTDQFGTSVAQALRVHSDTLRVQRRQRAEEKAAKLPLKLLFPLIFFIFPSLFVVIIGPAMIQVFRVIVQR